MNQVSRPMQILLGAVLVFAVLWFAALKPKTPVEEPIAAQPATPTETPAAAAGGEEASSALGKTVESANNMAAGANSAVAKSESQTGEETPADSGSSTDASSSSESSSSPSSDAPQPKTGAADADGSGQATQPEGAKAEKAKTNPQQAKANAVIRSIQKDLKARRAAVVLVYQAKGKEDQILKKRIKGDIDRRSGRVRTYFIPVSQVGYYEGLLSGLNLAQTPSTIVIAPDNQAKVLGGITSAARIDRLTSSAILTPAPTTP